MAPVALYLLDKHIDRQNVYDSFRHFIVSNGVVGATAGIAVGISTVALVYVVTLSVIMPLIALMLRKPVSFIHRKAPAMVQKYVGAVKFDIPLVIRTFLVWIIIILLTFVLLEYGIRRWFHNPPSHHEPHSHSP